MSGDCPWLQENNVPRPYCQYPVFVIHPSSALMLTTEHHVISGLFTNTFSMFRLVVLPRKRNVMFHHSDENMLAITLYCSFTRKRDNFHCAMSHSRDIVKNQKKAEDIFTFEFKVRCEVQEVRHALSQPRHGCLFPSAEGGLPR